MALYWWYTGSKRSGLKFISKWGKGKVHFSPYESEEGDCMANRYRCIVTFLRILLLVHGEIIPSIFGGYPDNSRAREYIPVAEKHPESIV